MEDLIEDMLRLIASFLDPISRQAWAMTCRRTRDLFLVYPFVFLSHIPFRWTYTKIPPMQLYQALTEAPVLEDWYVASPWRTRKWMLFSKIRYRGWALSPGSVGTDELGNYVYYCLKEDGWTVYFGQTVCEQAAHFQDLTLVLLD
jgi:hypothetical protein